TRPGLDRAEHVDAQAHEATLRRCWRRVGGLLAQVPRLASMSHHHHLRLAVGGAVAAVTLGTASAAAASPPATQCAGLAAATTPVAFWSTEARCAIAPPSAGPENFGNKFPGEAAVYAGIAH